MYATGDFIASGQQFNAEFWGPSTKHFMDYLVNNLSEKHWDCIFNVLDSFSAQAVREEAIHNSLSVDLDERVPLPLSDPPSPARDD